ncbi:DNA repair protein RadA [Arthrospira platensis]|uniref:DNA repair protein RadA n=1 Tax=Limnospira platensis NIES-46 TaxID=1236695 RepID=A0A5M3T2L4_LIMPL|nr:DNA repair protein RadA [Arthrospira platensis]AMW29628.1 DNA repair protein RadA [Arthrospira platensis YZ]KDR57114.1 lipoprotein [Arthrospira platensis str. Paraca]MDF2212406.1 DNA repair protein RadA [Arthrospira platensis NCB002]MDT9181609.1 DNA repair protein RadA [Limnospira sp. PMC 289.06]MDT9293868.1 DNA repair protein RadA [Arthrospira platensis PCC 7345]MDT9309226.1 DNA repair protein RadA [Limnospira sp. Paracas R14]QQW27557.1 DNA repair protein RadA [Arthrospira sp. PCC 9108]
MPKPRTLYVCRECGAEFSQYFGRCSNCQAWNSLVEQVVEPSPTPSLQRFSWSELGSGLTEDGEHKPNLGQPRLSFRLSQISDQTQSRIPSGYGELDRVLGGGIVPGSLVLIGGEPGIGKSTLLLQVANSLSHHAMVLYVSAEESGQQVKLRSQRLWNAQSVANVADDDGDGDDDLQTDNHAQVNNHHSSDAVEVTNVDPFTQQLRNQRLDQTSLATGNGNLSSAESPPELSPESENGQNSQNSQNSEEEQDLFLLPETDLEVILRELESLKPTLAIIDSIQTVYFASLTSAPGSVAQVRECTSALMQVAKRENITLLIVGHVTKDGSLAGPRVLEHLVDTVLYFEGDRFASHRLLRSMKNRFGATHEIGVFEMVSHGLQEVSNPSELFLGNRDDCSPGTATIVSMEGTRPIVVEIQALVSPASYGSARRTTTGVDSSRLMQILAVLEKRVGIPLSKLDAIVASVGGLKVDEPAADLGVAIAIVASFRDRLVDPRTILIGEVGLGGQVRPVSQLELRLREAAKLGFKRAIVPKGQKPEDLGMQILPVGRVIDAILASIPTQPPNVSEGFGDDFDDDDIGF